MNIQHQLIRNYDKSTSAGMFSSRWNNLASSKVSGFLPLKIEETYPLLPTLPTKSLFLKPVSFIFTLIVYEKKDRERKK